MGATRRERGSPIQWFTTNSRKRCRPRSFVMVKAEAQQSINRQLNVVLNWGEELMLHRRPLA